MVKLKFSALPCSDCGGDGDGGGGAGVDAAPQLRDDGTDDDGGDHAFARAVGLKVWRSPLHGRRPRSAPRRHLARD